MNEDSRTKGHGRQIRGIYVCREDANFHLLSGTMCIMCRVGCEGDEKKSPANKNKERDSTFCLVSSKLCDDGILCVVCGCIEMT